jgi:hypothetical protein
MHRISPRSQGLLAEAVSDILSDISSAHHVSMTCGDVLLFSSSLWHSGLLPSGAELRGIDVRANVPLRVCTYITFRAPRNAVVADEESRSVRHAIEDGLLTSHRGIINRHFDRRRAKRVVPSEARAEKDAAKLRRARTRALATTTAQRIFLGGLA